MIQLRRDPPLVVGPPPRVNLLPPEVTSARSWRKVRRGIVLAAVTSILFSALVGGRAYLAAAQSAAALERAQISTQSLLATAQGYAGVTAVESRIAQATAARAGVTSNWIDWQLVLKRVVKALPEASTLTTFTATIATTDVASAGGVSVAGAAVPSGTVATVSLGATASSLSAVQAWIASMSSMPGYLSADPGSVSADDTGSIKVGVTLYLGDEVYSVRKLVPVPLSTVAPIPVPVAIPTPVATPAPVVTPAPVAPDGTTALVCISSTPDSSSSDSPQTLVCTSTPADDPEVPASSESADSESADTGKQAAIATPPTTSGSTK